MYKESYLQLFHGTTDSAAASIITNGFIFSKAKGNWCGEGYIFMTSKQRHGGQLVENVNSKEIEREIR